MKKVVLSLLVSFALFASIGFVSSAVNSVTPSTNEINQNNSWAHVNQLDVDIGQTTLEFVSERNFYSCFEYRTDGDTSQQISSTNYNTDVSDGLYPYVCVRDESVNMTFEADEYVEVRMVFGAERDERFDWTMFEVLPEPTKAEVLMAGGVEGKGIATAPGLQKVRPNENFAKGLMNK